MYCISSDKEAILDAILNHPYTHAYSPLTTICDVTAVVNYVSEFHIKCARICQYSLFFLLWFTTRCWFMALFRCQVLKQRFLVPRVSSAVVYYVHSHLQYTPSISQVKQALLLIWRCAKQNGKFHCVVVLKELIYWLYICYWWQITTLNMIAFFSFFWLLFPSLICQRLQHVYPTWRSQNMREGA